jgi:hypothetical protein
VATSYKATGKESGEALRALFLSLFILPSRLVKGIENSHVIDSVTKGVADDEYGCHNSSAGAFHRSARHGTLHLKHRLGDRRAGRDGDDQKMGSMIEPDFARYSLALIHEGRFRIMNRR